VPSGVRENGTAPGPVVIGESREDATAAFGPTWDDFFVTTYAEQAAEVDLGSVTALGLAAGTGFEPCFEAALARVEAEPGFVLEVELAASTAATVHDRLAAAGLHLTGVHTAHDRVVVRIGRVAEVAADAPAPSAPPSPRPPRPAAPAATTTRHVGRLDRLRSGGRRVRLAALAGVLVVLAAVLAVAAVTAGVDGAVVVLVVAVLLGEAVLAVLVRRAVLAANRAAHRPVPDPRPLLLRNRRMLDKRTARIVGRVREVQGDTSRTRTELAALRRYVEAVAEEQARLRARLDRDQIPDLPRDADQS
jgi:hypothetical protein